MILLGLVFGITCVCLWCLLFILGVVGLVCQSATEPSDWPERLRPEMTCYELSGTLNSTHLLTLRKKLIKITG